MSGSKSLAERLAPQKERAESFLRGFEWTWTSAIVFSMAILFFILITMAVIPSFWLYFADQKLMWDGGVDHPLFPWSWAQKVLPWVIPGFWLKESPRRGRDGAFDGAARHDLGGGGHLAELAAEAPRGPERGPSHRRVPMTVMR